MGTPQPPEGYSAATPVIRLVAIGDELVDGHTQDSNSREVALALDSLGLRVKDMRQVRDREEELLREAASLLRGDEGLDLVISTGGLGPTLDDRSRQVLARAFGAQLVFDEVRWSWLEAWFRERGRVAGPQQHSQALHPQPGGLFPNQVGTAAGLLFESGGKSWIALPGVPSEMRHLLQDEVLPWLGARLGHRQRERVLAFRSRRLPEAELSRRLEPLEDLEALGEVGFYPHADGVLLRLRLPALPGAEQEVRATAARDLVRQRLGAALLVEDGRPVVELVFHSLLAQGQSLALAESCTGGWLARDITAFPGSSKVFRGAVVAYANAVKESALGVPAALLEEHGAVSEACAGAMALGARERMGSTWSVAVTGIAGPEGGTLEKPVGTVWLAVAGPAGLCARRLDLRGNREQIRARAAGQAWLQLYEAMQGQAGS
jgi:nicotinamide-nucleotide amidase